jgi:PAP2 superfamily
MANKVMIYVLLATAFILSAQSSYSQHIVSMDARLIPADSVYSPVNWETPSHSKAFSVKQYLLPAALVAYGFTALEDDGVKNKLNLEVQEEIWTERPHALKHIDNFLQFAPAIVVYGLNAAGVKGKNNFRDRTMIYFMSNIIMNTTVFSIKKLSHQLRPDGSDYYSFPSGHTAEAFASAEFLRQEYQDVSPWYGVAGYAMAAGTGYLRIYNNKHWLNDVVAGAGIGIASTKLAYWIYPKIQHKLFKDRPVHTLVMPNYQNGAVGVGLVHTF